MSADPPKVVTWDAFFRAFESLRDQKFGLVQLVTACPGDGFEVVTVTIRKPEDKERV